MSKSIIYFLVKTFMDPAHAEQFLDGLLYMNSLDYFAKLEESDSAGRGDRHEGTVAWLQPGEIQLVLKLEIDGFRDGVRIDRDLAELVSIQQGLETNIFCMHAGYVGGNAPSEFATPDEFEQCLKIPPENVTLGQHSIVITNVKEFLRRVATAAREQNVSLRGDLVRYYDPETFSGFFTEGDAPFNKQMRFAHQREYRLVVSRQGNDASPFRLNIGSLRDIAAIASIEAINDGLKIHTLPPEVP